MPVNCILNQYGCKEQVCFIYDITFHLVSLIQILRGDLKRHYVSEEHQRAVIFCVNQLYSQFVKGYQLHNTTVDTDVKMETSDVSSKVTTASHRTTTAEIYKDEIEHLYEMIDLLSLGVGTLSVDITRLGSESLQQSQSLETTDKAISAIKLSIEESKNVMDAMNTNFTILQQELLSLKQKCQDRQVTSYDGTLIWKIDRFQEKMGKNIYYL